jgi:enoyl-CoA hydratase
VIHSEDRGLVRTLRLSHGKVQALDIELAEALTGALNQADADDVGAMILTGTGSCFSAGVDLLRIIEGGTEYVRRFLTSLHELLITAFRFPRPFVAAVNGHAVAGGAILAWCGDVRLMAAGSGRIGVPELRVGVPFPTAALEIVRFATGGRHIQELVYLGRTYGPEDALARGLVDEVTSPDELVDRAVQVGSSLAGLPRESFALTKNAVRRPVLEVIDRSAGRHDEQVVAEWLSPATHGAIRSYLRELADKSRRPSG